MSIALSKSSQWLHPDYQLAPDAGVTYELRYVGAMPVRISIKSVDLSTRTKIAWASIHRVCADVGLKLPHTQSVDKSIKSYIGPLTDMTWAMTNVYLTITSRSLTVETLNQSILMFQHNLFLVSFASGGDAETMDFICYVAKTDQDTRMCYVFECPGGLAQEVIITIGQAFQLGFKNFKSGSPPSQKKLQSQLSLSEKSSHKSDGCELKSSKDCVLQPTSTKTLVHSTDDNHTNTTSNIMISNLPSRTDRQSFNQETPMSFDNFVDFDDNSWLLQNEICSLPNLITQPITNTIDTTSTTITNTNSVQCKNKSDQLIDLNQNIENNNINHKINSQLNDNCEKTVHNNLLDTKNKLPRTTFDHLEPIGEPWYVGKMSRSQAESLLRYDGDFLVRASIQQPGQFVLSGLQNGKCKHLLLADPNGKVRTKERVFDSIQHLIDYHLQNGAPIRSSDSEIKLIFPVSTHTFCVN